MISHASHASVWCLVGDSSMCWDTALDKAFENVFCILAILRFQTKNRFCESSQRLIQPRLVRWKKTLIGPRGVEEKDVMEAYQQAAIVKKGVRFFSYGMDISKWPVVPPYSMAFCIARDMKTIDGIFPIRIKPIDQTTYELIMPPQLDNMASGSLKYLFWAINFQYSCTDGWVFRFP